METLAYYDTFIWLIALVLFLVIEILSLNLVTIWFAAGSFAALMVSIYKIPTQTSIFNVANKSAVGILWQFVIFLIVSSLFIVLVMPLVRKKVNSLRIKTNVEEMEDQIGIVQKAVMVGVTGQIKVKGQIWTAASETQNFTVGEKVKVKSIQGVKAMIEKI